MVHRFDRRRFLESMAAYAASAVFSRTGMADGPLEYEMALVESSFRRAIAEKKIGHLDVARIAKTDLQLAAVEYVSTFFEERSDSDRYIDEMNKRAGEHDVRQLLIIVDGEGLIGDVNPEKRRLAMVAHQRWVDTAQALGCHSIQINPVSSGDEDEQRKRAVESLLELCEYAVRRKINLLLGNYGGCSATAEWVMNVVKSVDRESCRTLAQIDMPTTENDYATLATVASLAKGLTANTYDFDDQGREVRTDYDRAMRVTQDAGYKGYVGIQYCGTRLDELAGIRASRTLLEQVRINAH